MSIQGSSEQYTCSMMYTTFDFGTTIYNNNIVTLASSFLYPSNKNTTRMF